MFGSIKHKRSFLLLEVVLSLGLLALLFGCLALVQKDLFFSRTQQNAVYQSFRDEQRAYALLRTFFHSAQNLEVYSTSDPKVCSCIFDRGVRRDPALSGFVRGELYFFQEKRSIELMVYNLYISEKNARVPVLDHVSEFCIIERSADCLECRITREVPGGYSHSLVYLFRLGL